MVEKLKKPALLIYAHYYHPDVASTGQILKELAEGMLDCFHITIICVVPSYCGVVDEHYKNKKYYFENINGVDIIRVGVPDFDKTRKMSRVKNILAYFFRAMKATGKVKNVNYVYSISQPPILGGVLGVWGKWMKHAKYIYNVQDYNPEQTIAVNYSKNKLILGAMMFFDKFSCKKADKVIVVGRDMVETLKDRFRGKKVPKHAFINNWIDENEIYPLKPNHEKLLTFKRQYGLDGKFVIMYSGNIGLYYDLEQLMKIIKKFRKGSTKNGEIEAGPITANGREVVFAFVGDGSIKDKLVLYKEKKNMDNVVFIPYQDREDLIYSLNAGDVHWVVNAKGIKGVSVPSKLYGIMAAGKPVLGVLELGSEARLIIEESGCGLLCEPGDYESVEKNIKWFIDNAENQYVVVMGLNGRDYLVKNLTKYVSVKKYIKAITDC